MGICHIPVYESKTMPQGGRRKDGVYMPKKKIERDTPKIGKVIDMKTMKPVEKVSIPLVCERIRHFRERRGMEQKELAKAIGITANAISNWENGRSRPDINLIPAICNVLEVSLYDIYAMDDPFIMYTAGEQMHMEKYRRLSPANRIVLSRLTDTLLDVQYAESVPDIKELLYFEKSLAAGFAVPDEFADEGTPIFLYNSENLGNADYVFTVNGDSMEPKFHNNDLVLVQRITDSSELKPGEIGAFITGNETYIKEFREDGLHSLNPKYKVMKFDDSRRVYLIGRVLGVLDQAQIASDSDVDKYEMMKLGDMK